MAGGQVTHGGPGAHGGGPGAHAQKKAAWRVDVWTCGLWAWYLQ